MIGEKISILENDKEIFGIFDDIDDEGFLLLKTKDKIEKIHFGDVTLGQ
jgi:BirA family biotin operon repressor/biotin-[acetyl-CoA-carboxylase] ligase